MTVQDTVDYINKSTLEREEHKVRGLFIPNSLKVILCFVDESYALKFATNDWILLNRDTRVGIPLSEVEFFVYLDMFIEMDLLRQNRSNIRKKIINSDIKDLIRDKKINNII